MTEDLYAIVRNNTKRSHIPLSRFSPVVASCGTIVQIPQQDIDIDTVLFTFLQFYFYSYVCVYVCLGVCEFIISASHVSRSTFKTQFHHHSDSSCPFTTTSISFLLLLTPEPLAATILVSMSINLSFQEYYKMESYSM